MRPEVEQRMQEKKEPGQGDMPGKQWPKEDGEQGRHGDIGKKGGSGDVGREGDKTGQTGGTEKKY